MDRTPATDEGRVDLLQGRAVVVVRELALGRVRSGHRQIVSCAELLGNGCDPLEQPLQMSPGRTDVSAREVDQLTGQAVANSAPEVLLDQPMWIVGKRLSLIERAGDPCRQPVTKRGQRSRLLEIGLPIADPDLDGRKAEVRPDAPPHLRVLGDRAGRVEEADVLLESLPAVVGVGYPAARKHAGEDLRPRGMQVSTDAFDERRAGGDCKELREVVPQRVADGDGTVGSPDADVNVEAEGVVAPDDVAENLVVSAVVRRVDDSLFLPGAPRMSADAGERDPKSPRELVELNAALADLRGRLGKAFAATGSHLDLRGDQLADEVLLERGSLRRRLQLLEPVRQRQRLGVEDGELLFDREGEVGAVLVRLAGRADLLVRGEILRVAHE